MKIKILFLISVLISAQIFAQSQLNNSNTASKHHLNSTQFKSVLPSNPMQADNSRSDTTDILKFTINLNVTSFVDSTISGNSQIKFTPKVNGLNKLNLDLLMLTVDSVKSGNNLLTTLYNDTLLNVTLPVTYNIGDTSSVTVYYHGRPQIDHPNQWGGFFFQGVYAYNIGVAFQALPHNYGRVWFPCFDNFVERAKFEFNITTNNGKIAYCNGYLANDTSDGNGNRTRCWKMDTEIPSYLASLSVAPYTQVNQTYNGMNGTIPIILTALPADTTNMKASFVNLPNALTAFENHFGPYRWNRVGYCLVPFTAGAMEHATNISYPKVLSNGSTTYQIYFIHELSHHWFGDLVTCRTAEDMWLNEGWAHYCEFIYTEFAGNYSNYLAAVKANHADNVQFLHVKEGGYQTLSNIPQTYTYGDHVYNKGADIAHTLRGYMGDSVFFYSLKSYLTQNSFKDVSSSDLRDALTAASGINLSDFFNDWVFNPGWPHFSIDSSVITPNGNNYNVAVYVKQKLTGAPNYYKNVPLEVTFKAANFAENTQTFFMTGHNQVVNFTVPFNPAFVAINKGSKISDAIVSDFQTITTIGSKTMGATKMSLNVLSLPDTAFIRVEHNFATPDDYKSCCIPYRLSPNHYWKVDGIAPAGFRSKAILYYDGRTSTSNFSGNLWLDYLLMGTEAEDSLVLMYRKNTASEWAVYPYYTKNQSGSNVDLHGFVTIDSLQFGEYVFAMNDYSLGINNKPTVSQQPSIKLFPNPANETVTVDLSSSASVIQTGSMLIISDVAGKIIHKEKLTPLQTALNINTSAYSNGIYFVTIKNNSAVVAKNKFVIAH